MKEPDLASHLLAFDFDSTLGKVPKETDQWMMSFISDQLGLPLQEVIDSTIRTKPYSLEAHFEFLSLTHGVANNTSLGVLQTLIKNLNIRFSSLLYPEVPEMLTHFRDHGATIAVITYGGTDYQSLKIAASGLSQYIDELRIVNTEEGKPIILKELIDKYKRPKTLYIDDKEE